MSIVFGPILLQNKAGDNSHLETVNANLQNVYFSIAFMIEHYDSIFANIESERKTFRDSEKRKKVSQQKSRRKGAVYVKGEMAEEEEDVTSEGNLELFLFDTPSNQSWFQF